MTDTLNDRGCNDYIESDLCKHGRLTTAYCEHCAELGVRHIVEERMQKELEENLFADYDGGNSEYYDLPPGFTYKGRQARIHDVIVAANMSWTQANIFKAAFRWEKKPNLQYNIRKILWFAKEEKDE